MPQYTATATGGATQFTGVAAASGLFAPGQSGAPDIQVRINSISFVTGGVITDWVLRLIDPAAPTFNPILLTDTTATFICGGPAGFMLLPTNSTGVAWSMSFVTTGMAAAGTIKIDYDFTSTES